MKLEIKYLLKAMYLCRLLKIWVKLLVNNDLVNLVKHFLIMPHDLLQDALKTALKTLIQNTAEANGDLIGNKIAVKIAGNSKTVPSKTEDV